MCNLSKNSNIWENKDVTMTATSYIHSSKKLGTSDLSFLLYVFIQCLYSFLNLICKLLRLKEKENFRVMEF